MTRIGLISDTHAPERLSKLPDTIFNALAGVDFIFHAGDVGELWVLDQLSRIAPVFAVHGNDDSADSKRELPYQQVIVVKDQRILLTHSHFPNRDEELAFRQLDAWGGKLDRRSNWAKRAGATIMVYGHSHVPMIKLHDNVLIVNPGAVASGNYLSKQTLQSVAVLEMKVSNKVWVTHINLADGRSFAPQIDWEAGFHAAYNHTQESILPDWLAERWEQINAIMQPAWPQFREALLRVGNRVWAGELPFITPEVLLVELRKENLPAVMMSQLEVLL